MRTLSIRAMSTLPFHFYSFIYLSFIININNTTIIIIIITNIIIVIISLL